MRVDGHAHLFAGTTVERRAVDELAPAERTASIEDLWAVADPVGVRAAVLVPLDRDDRTCAAALAAWPGRCAGVAVAGPEDHGPQAGDALRRRRESYRFDAVRLRWLAQPGTELTASPAWPLLRAMAEDDLVLWAYLPPDQVDHLSTLTALLPELRVVLNHFGFAPSGMQVDEFRRPRFPGALDAPTRRRVAALADRHQVHLMISGHYALTRSAPPYPDLVAASRELVAAFGAERCLWGSDFPWPAVEPGYRRTLEAAEHGLGPLRPDERDQIFGGTARRLFPAALGGTSTDHSTPSVEEENN